MAFHPFPGHLVAGGRLDQLLPNLDIFHRFVVGGPPAPFLPAEHPFGDAIHDIFAVGVERYRAWLLEQVERFKRRRHFHAVVGRLRLAAGDFLFRVAKTQHRAPTARARIALARAIGENLDPWEIAHAPSNSAASARV